MAVPKKKISTSRRGMRRSHDALKSSNVIECPNCGEPKLAHQMCLYCNYYDGRDVIEVKTDSKPQK
tara:strand:- start:39 stop:236 length:198 start_codon:yes stop_codon:yes gene_type:complete